MTDDPMAPIDPRHLTKDVSSRLAQVRVLIADDDRRIAILVRSILESLGFTQISVAKDGSQALEMLRTEKSDMLITDWQMSPMDGINLVKYLRTSDDSPNRFLPVIMLTGNADRQDVEVARDAGVTEFVVKPFSAKTLCDRIVLLIENPRSFVMTKRFVGPDRRRRSLLPPDGTEKRR